MSGPSDLTSAFERNTQAVLEAGLAHIDAATRSRLNQARQAALAAAGTRRSPWLIWGLMPATGALAAAVVVAVLLSGRPAGVTPAGDSPASALDVLDLVTDDDTLGLLEDGDNSFYEWAAAQGDASPGLGASGADT